MSKIPTEGIRASRSKTSTSKFEDLATTTSEIADGTFTSRFFSFLFTHITAWFANATNGIGDFFAQVGNFGRVNTDELCVGSTCVTEDEFRSLLTGSAAQTSGESAGAADTPSAGSPPEVPAASPAQEGTDTDDAATTTPNVSVLQPTSEDASEPAEPGASEAPEAEAEQELAPANDNNPVEPLPATGTQ